MNNIKSNRYLHTVFFLFLVSFLSYSQVTLEKEVKITDAALYFNGSVVNRSLTTNNGNPEVYDFVFGRQLSAHPNSDSVKTYGDYVFMGWYKGGKMERDLMLTRYNKVTGSIVTLKFPHKHTGYLNQWWLGEAHNYVSIAVSPIDGTIHMLYDMHAYSNGRPNDGSLSEDYFRYSYSVANAASLPDEEFTLDKFIEKPGNPELNKHLSLNSGKPGFPDEEYSNFQGLTYPQFFMNDKNEIVMYIREGGNTNGAYKFTKYDADTGIWSNFTHFNVLNANRQAGISHNWGLYGTMKYVNGKIRIGFQRRLGNANDKYKFQNGVYYAYSDNQNGSDNWKNYKGEPVSLPIFDADKIKVMEPGDYVETTKVDQVNIVAGFDWTVTDNEDVHIISRVRDSDNNVTKNLHTYKPSGAEEFITTEDFEGASYIYTAGNNIYIIGLNNGKVFIKKAEGGTNDFTTVYEAASGRDFNHGRVYINNGKLYYFLLEGNETSAQPLYLQIIDLDIPPTDPTLADNFTIKTTGETCPNKANGTLSISAGAISNYTAKLNGVDYSFTKTTTIDNLTPGNYDLCIEITEENVTRCYTVHIGESETLAAKIQVSNKTAEITVASGSAPYTVLKNGEEVFKTNKVNFAVNVNDGDIIQVRSKDACQGDMQKTISLDDIKVYPNPSNGLFNLFVSKKIQSISIELYDVTSRLLTSKKYNVNAGKIELNLQDKPNGIYFIRVNLEQPIFVKVIKQ